MATSRGPAAASKCSMRRCAKPLTSRGDVHRLRAGCFGDREHFPDPVAAAEDKVAAARGERAVEVVKRLDQEPESVGRAVWCIEHGVVEDEKGNDVVRFPNGGGEHRIVTKA